MTGALWRAAGRMLLLQGSLNYERLQGLGVAVASAPLLQGLDPETRRSATARAAGFFNSHPYLAGFAVGALARAEIEGIPEAQIERLRAALRGSLGAMGDRLVWAGTLPAVSAVALIAGTMGGPAVGVGVFLVLHNVVHLGLRWWGLRRGWATGMGVATAVQTRVLRDGLRWAEVAALVAVGAAVPVAGRWLAGTVTGGAWWGAVVVAGGTVIAGLTAGAAGHSGRLGLMALVVILLLGWV